MVPAPTKDDNEFIADLARYAEALVSEADIKRKYRFDDEVWTSLGSDDELVRAIEAEKVRRIRDGSSKREKSQLLITRAPAILDGIMSDPAASPRHRVDAIKTLDGFAANGPGATAPASDRFIITINLGDETLTFNKSIRPIEPGEIDPDDSGSDADIGALAAIAKKETEGGSGEPL
jgi:hypothetical protein